MVTIALVEDEKEIADLLATYLENEGYTVKAFYDGISAHNYFLENQPDLALLDVMLPDITGLTLLQEIRREHFYPVIFLTAKGEALDKINGLTLGADDYITKPFNPLEVVARVKTQLRRVQRYNQSTIISTEKNEAKDMEEIQVKGYDRHGLRLEPQAHKVFLYDKEIFLTPLEFSILSLLMEQQGNVVSSEKIFETVWGEKFLDNNNTVMAHIARLREKLSDTPQKPKFIKTVWGVGYTLV
ncbi:response regulator transcription factor [Enterococcus timonensis]|uniref:response regulator transcription factor n=1 Tax=Enterococcus timonensis TaxID=1852364 RepID=UPI0008D958B4|nr:response regulator transcription factor [Enterococcus timonensis]